MAEQAELLLLIEARDLASKIVEHFGGEVATAGKTVQKTASEQVAATKKTRAFGASFKESLAPMRNFQSIIGTLGLATFGLSIAGAVMGIKHFVSASLAADRAFGSLRIGFLRTGMSIADVNSTMRQLEAILGRTAATSLAQMDDETLAFTASISRSIPQVLKMAETIQKWTGIPISKTMQDLKKSIDEVGETKALALLAQQATDAATNASELQKRYEGFKTIWKPIGAAIGEALLLLITPPVTAEEWRGGWQFLDDPFVNFKNSLVQWGQDVYADLIMPFQWVGKWFEVNLPKSWGFIMSGWTAVVFWAKTLWFDFTNYLGDLLTSVSTFWQGIWGAMKGFGIGVYNWIIDRLNDAVGWINGLIRMYNNTIGKIASPIGEIGFRFGHAAAGGPEVIAAPRMELSAIELVPTGAKEIIVPVIIGNKTIEEIVINALTGAVRRREVTT